MNRLDRARQFELFKEELHDIEEHYFGPTRTLTDPERAQEEGIDEQIPVIGEFRYIPDPDVPPECPVPPAVLPGQDPTE